MLRRRIALLRANALYTRSHPIFGTKVFAMNLHLFCMAVLFCTSILQDALYARIPLRRVTTEAVAPQTPNTSPQKRDNGPLKEWSVLVYIAANNDLHSFADANVKQLMALGSNELINLVMQIDKFGTRDVVRALITKGSTDIYWKASNASPAQRAAQPEFYNSGSTVNFVDFLQTAIQKFPAKKYCVIVWDHGSGLFDPLQWRTFAGGRETRGVAFNDTYNYYLSNTDVTTALRTVCQTSLNGKPIDVLGLDTCVSAQIEIASQVKGLVRYMVASQESEIAYGWNYTKCFARASKEARSPYEFCTDIIDAYKDEYARMLPDYTLAVYDLDTRESNQQRTFFEALEEEINALSTQLVALLQTPQSKLIKQLLADIRKRKNLSCEFYSSEYIDLNLFLMSLQNSLRQALNVSDFKKQYTEATKMVQECIAHCLQALDLINKVIPYWVSGPAFSGNPVKARGISITFPPKTLYSAYAKTAFFQNNQWYPFLKKYLGY